MTDTSAATTYAQRVGFVSEMASRLHRYGTTAQRMESTVIALSQRLGVDCEPWSSPTGIILSFNDPTRPLGATDTTRVLRLGLGETDLNKLSETDRIAEDVVAGKMSVADGHTALRKLDTPTTGKRKLLELLASGLASGAVAALWRLPWLDIATAGIIGLLIGLLFLFIERRPQMKEAGDAIAALVASGVTLLVANFVAPLNLNTVIIASLIVLLPGMALTNSVNELTSQHLVSGIARFAGAMATILKLTVGSVLAVTLAQLLGLYPEVRALRPQPDWVEWTALVVAAYAFAVLFRAHRRDYVWVITASVVGYVISRSAGAAWGSPAGIFLSALVVTAGGNAFARWANRPGAIIRVPGILMLVPGSASLRGLMSLVQQQDMGVGQSALLGVMNIVMALIAGLLFGNLLVSARKTL